MIFKVPRTSQFLLKRKGGEEIRVVANIGAYSESVYLPKTPIVNKTPDKKIYVYTFDDLENLGYKLFAPVKDCKRYCNGNCEEKALKFCKELVHQKVVNFQTRDEGRYSLVCE